MDTSRYARKRLAAAAMDTLLVVGLWLLVTTAIGFGMSFIGTTPTTPEGWDVYAFCTLVGPTVVTFAWLEASPRSTPGKRRMELAVVDGSGNQLSRQRSLARSALRFVPWQLAHTAVYQLSAGRESLWIWVLCIGAQVWVAATWLCVLVDKRHRALHDRLTATEVVPRSL